jgi:hypothetical protein
MFKVFFKERKRKERGKKKHAAEAQPQIIW